MSSECDRVLVAGAGPVGMTAALLLARAGVPVTVIESDSELTENIRASGFHPSTLDLLEECGASAALIAQGRVCRELQYRDRQQGKIVELDYSLLKNDTRHPFRLQCEQYKLTHWAAGQFVKIPGAELLLSHRLVSVVQDEFGLEAKVETEEGLKTIRAKYLIGADGSRSAARKSVGISFEGFTYPERYLVMGSPADFKKAIPDLASLNYIADARESFNMFQNADHWKIGFLLPHHVQDEEALSDENVEQKLQSIAPQKEKYDAPIRGIFRVHQRVASTYRAGRVFLAGDAAHINNPAGGMGMNGGLHDAVNLTGRIARVWRGEAGEEELDGYEAQRRPIAVGAIAQQTDRNHRALVETDHARRERMLAGWRSMAEDKALAYQHMLQVSMIGPLRQSGMLL